jgi:RNA polymerase sigma-70 factor (ECF subfamily)
MSQAEGVSPAVTIAQPANVDFTALFQDNFDYVWRTLRRLGVGQRDLEDVAHEVFLAVHRRLDAYDPARPVRPWLFAFALRTAADYRRLARHRVDLLDDASPLPDPKPGPEDQMITKQALDVVTCALDTLELERRAILVLHEIDGVAVPAAAEVLGIPVNTAYSRLRLAREDFTSAVRRISARRGGIR